MGLLLRSRRGREKKGKREEEGKGKGVCNEHCPPKLFCGARHPTA